jgi:hypothetical protein
MDVCGGLQVSRIMQQHRVGRFPYGNEGWKWMDGWMDGNPAAAVDRTDRLTGWRPQSQSACERTTNAVFEHGTKRDSKGHGLRQSNPPPHTHTHTMPVLQPTAEKG